GESVTVVAKHRGADNYWWLALEDDLWIRSDLVVRAEAGELPLDLSRLPEVDATGLPVPQAPPIPEAAAGAGNATPALTSGNVLFIVDGDTIHVNVDGREVRVRYIGINTPERNEYGYQSATLANQALVEGRTVRLVADADNLDDYSRLLRYVYVDHDDTPSTPDLFVNKALIEAGWADLLTIDPNTTHAAELSAALTAAQSAKVGLWQ
ncbi:MAG: thermonuclease family protein, partial [Caldilineaceae bacterium]